MLLRELHATAAAVAFLLLLLYIGLVVVVALLAVLHPDRGRRGEARRVLAALLAVLPGRRR